MKFEIHLETVEFKRLQSEYLKSANEIGLGKQLQVSGDFCLEQTCFL